MRAAPPWSEALQRELAGESDFEWLDEERAEQVTQLSLEVWARFPLADPAQSEGAARLARSLPLAFGPTRQIRLSENSQTAVLLFDPSFPTRVFLSLGTNFPPGFWPSAPPTLAGIKEAFAPYFARPFMHAAKLSRSLRLGRGSLEELELESIERLAELIAASETWMDGEARWFNGLATDPWPEDPMTSPMMELRLCHEDSKRTYPDIAPSVSMRTLWSRSVITIEQGSFEQLIFSLRYEPAPFVAWHPHDPQNELGLPDDLPADVMASLLRAPVTSLPRISALLQETLDPMLVLSALLLEPEPTQLKHLRALLRSPEDIEPAMQIAQAFGAFGLLGELEVETTDEALRARLAKASRLQAPAPQQEAP